MPYTLPPLPYTADALQPYISKQTMVLHYTKHHQGYVTKLNGLIQEKHLEERDLDSIIQAAIEIPDQQLFNMAAQVWNHNFFWNSMTANPKPPSDELTAAIKDAFGGISGFNKVFKEAATGVFGSGWAWLVVGDSGLEVMGTTAANLPLAHGKTALLCCDVWEHAYYLDYQNERGKFVDVFLASLINWDFASDLFAAAGKVNPAASEARIRAQAS